MSNRKEINSKEVGWNEATNQAYVLNAVEVIH